MVNNGQCLIDVCMLHTGTADQLYNLAAEQGLSITDALTPGIFINTGLESIDGFGELYKRLLSRQPPASQPDTIPGDDKYGSWLLPVNNTEAEVYGVKVQPLQCLADIAMQYLGSSEPLFGLATEQDLSITDFLGSGSYMLIKQPVVQSKMVRYLNINPNQPASDMNDNTPPLSLKLEGIDYWYLNEYIVQ